MSEKKMWPTPVVSDSKGSVSMERWGGYTEAQRRKRVSTLKDAVLWPTPACQESEHPFAELTENGRRKTGNGNSHSLNLADSVRIWPTPIASEARQGFQDRSRGKKGSQESLSTAVMKKDILFPTPGTTGLSNGSGNCEKANELYEAGVISDEERKSFRAGNGGQLNPDWTAWLMGWPIGWDSLKPMKKEAFETWREKAIKGTLWTVDPADLSPTDEGYIPRITNEKTFRQHRLKALGNGQVPSAACLAESILQEVSA